MSSRLVKKGSNVQTGFLKLAFAVPGILGGSPRAQLFEEERSPMEVQVSGRGEEPDKLSDERMERDGAQLFGMDGLEQVEGEEMKQSRKRRRIGCLPCAVPRAWKRAAQKMQGSGAMSTKEVRQPLAAAMLATLNYQHGGKRRLRASDVEGQPETEPQRRKQRYLLRRAQEHLRADCREHRQ